LDAEASFAIKKGKELALITIVEDQINLRVIDFLL
jgi:hypothetical protein